MSPYGPGAISFEFAQVGKDQKAQRFLGELDNDIEIGVRLHFPLKCTVLHVLQSQKPERSMPLCGSPCSCVVSNNTCCVLHASAGEACEAAFVHTARHRADPATLPRP